MSKRDQITYQLEFGQDPNSGKRNRSWVKLIPMGETIEYRGREIEFSEDYLKALVAESVKLNAYFDQKARKSDGEAYRFPVLRNHEKSHDREGDLLQLKVSDKQGFDGLWGQLRWTDETRLAIESDKVKHVSVGIVPEYTTESGETYGPVIREVSLTSDPFLKGIGTIQDTLEVSLSQQIATELGALDMEPEALMNLIKEGQREVLSESLEPLMERLNALEEKDTAEPEELETSEEVDTEPVDTEPVEDSEPVQVEASQTASEEDSEPVTLSAIKGLIDPISQRLDALETRSGVRLNTTEKGHQGDPPSAPVELSYEDEIARIMKRENCSRLEAIDIELKQ